MLVILAAFIAFTINALAQAQSELEYGSYSINDLANLSIYTEYYRQWERLGFGSESFNPEMVAYGRKAFSDCPGFSEDAYIRGQKILDYLILSNRTDPKKALAYVDTLGLLYDKRAEYFPNKKGTNESQVEDLMLRKKNNIEAYKKLLSSPQLADKKFEEKYSQPNNKPNQNLASNNITNNTQSQNLTYLTQPSKVYNQNKDPLSPSNKARNYRSLPGVGPVAGEFYVGKFMGSSVPKSPAITNRDMTMVWEFDFEKGCIAFSTPFPQGGRGKEVANEKMTIALGNGGYITKNGNITARHYYYDAYSNLAAGRHLSSSVLYLPDYKEDEIVISWVNLPEQTGKPDRNGYYTIYQDHKHQIDYTLPINVKEAKLYYYFYQAKNASLKDAITYLKDCKIDDYRQIVENEIVNNKISKLSDVIYCNDNYPILSDQLENKMFSYISSMADCHAYLKYYSTSKGGSALDDKVYQYVNASNEVGDCETYLKYFPNGNHKSAVTTQKNEIISYNAARKGGKTECTAYLTMYPKGRFTSEIQNKKDGIVKEEHRQAQIKVNSNKGIWKLGNKLCNCTSDGIIMATLDQWNEDHSSFKGIIAASPGGLFQGDLLQKGNQLWFETKDWHKCLDDEVEYALNHDKSLEAEQLLKAKKMKFARGSVVVHTYYTRGWLFSSSYRVTAKVDDWNDDYTRMKIQIIKTDGLDYIDGESIYEGKYIWVSPIGWE